MKHILSSYLNKTIEIHIGGSMTIKGKLLDIVDDLVRIETQDETTCYVPLDKIHMFYEVKEKDKPVGFVTQSGHRE